MERILRSIIQIGNLPDSGDSLKNWLTLKDHNIDFKIEQDAKIFDYLESFYGSMNAPPDFSLVREYFEKKDDIETVSRLDEIKSAQFYIRTNFLAIVRDEADQQQQRKFVVLMREATQITESGRNLEKPINGKKVLRGVNDAMGYIFDKMSNFTRAEGGERLEGVITEESEEVISEADLVAKSKTFTGRNIFGLEQVDDACKGHRPGEYWIHCAFSGELKSTCAINYTYNNAYLFGKNIFYANLEMSYKQLRRQIYVLHSSHGKFVTEWYAEDKRNKIPETQCYRGIHYGKVRDGELSELEWIRFKKVAQDFESTCKGKIYIWRPEEETTIAEIKRRSEMFNNKHGCDGLIIDYLGLVKPKYRNSDNLANINNVVREGRLLALNFARGKTIPLLALFQLNRQGKLRADKADGRYDMSSISQSNQVEKDSDVITYTYLNDQLRKEGKFYFGNLKNRDNPIFERMVGKILWNSKRMRSIDTGQLDNSSKMIVENLNVIADLSASDLF